MISYHYAQLIDTFVSYFSDENYVIQRLFEFSTVYEKVSPSLAELTINLNNSVTVQDRCSVISQTIKNDVRDIKDNTTTSEFFTELRDLIVHADQLTMQLSSKSLNITQHLEQVNKAYNNYIDSQSVDVATLLIIQSHRAYAAISAFRDTLSSVRNNLISEPPKTTEKQEVLTLYFSHQSDFETLTRKLSALLAAYKELCVVVGISNSDQPLQIVKVETGSIFIKVIGALLPIKLLESFIKKAAEIFYRRFIREGRIETESEYRKEIIEEIGLSNALKKEGINTAEIDERIRFAAKKHSENLFTLMYGEPSVEINGEKITIGDSKEQQFIEQSKTRRLEYQETNNPDNKYIQSDETNLDEGDHE